MITFSPDVSKIPSPFPSKQETFDIIQSYLVPLQKSQNKKDTYLYAQAMEHISYFRERLGLEPYQPPNVKINNWQFLQLLATCWRVLDIANSERATPHDLTHRIGLEDAVVRTLSKYKVCYTNTFKGQTHYAIFGFNPEILTCTLEDVLAAEGQLKQRQPCDRKS